MIDEVIMTEEIASEEICEDTECANHDEEHATESIVDTATEGDEADDGAIDYAALVESDLRELKGQFPELAGIADITEIDNPLRYAALRDLGLTPREAYLATNERRSRKDNRSHLHAAVPRGAGVPRGGMSREELSHARELFSGMSDTQIQALYRRVNAQH